MKNYSHKPTDENAIQLLHSNMINRNQDISQFMTLLSNMEDDCYSIALNGEWGSGKTFFIKQVKLLLDARNPHSSMDCKVRGNIERTQEFQQFPIPECYTTVYYDAWINDHHEDPILSLMYTTLINIQEEVPEKHRSLIDIVTALASAVSGRDISAVLQKMKGSDDFSELAKADDIRTMVKEFVDQLIQEHGNRLVFFIDELDRCKPDYAIRFLERIKHYFDDDRITFVFAVSLSQLQSAVKNYYGLEYNATRYLDKFFDLHITLRSIDIESFLSRRIDIDSNNISGRTCIAAAKHFNFSLRELERYGRMMRIADSAIKKHSGGFPDAKAMVFALGYILPIMLALQMYDMALYNKFVSGTESEMFVNILLKPDNIVRTCDITSLREVYEEQTQTITYESGKGSGSIADRIQQIYKALFVNRLTPGSLEIKVGDMAFGYTTKQHLEEIASMLSPWSDYQFE